MSTPIPASPQSQPADSSEGPDWRGAYIDMADSLVKLRRRVMMLTDENTRLRQALLDAQRPPRDGPVVTTVYGRRK